jgi:acetyltransferase-like isoleucine patch superfamily enzyme
MKKLLLYLKKIEKDSLQKKHKLYRAGNNVEIRCKASFAGFNTVDSCSILEGGNIEMGRYSSVSSNCVLRGPIRIGSFTQIGPMVSIFANNHPFRSLSINVNGALFNGERKKLQQQAYSKEVFIGSDVWIGAGATILSGVSVGNGAIIAAGAVVNKNVEPFTIVGGVPAKQIGLRYSEEVISKLVKLCWWDKCDKELETVRAYFAKDNLAVEDVDALAQELK